MRATLHFMWEAVLDVGKAIRSEGVEPFHRARGQWDAVHRTTRNEQRNPRRKAMLLAIDRDLTFTLQPIVHFGMGMAVQGKGISL